MIKYILVLISLSLAVSILIFSCKDNSEDIVFIKCNECHRIEKLLQKNSNDSSVEERSENLIEAYELCRNIKQDSLRINYLFKVSVKLLSIKEYEEFKKVNTDLLNNSRDNNDSMKIADSYWNMGLYYSQIEVLDSAFYNFSKARFIFKEIGNPYYTAKMEYNIAYLLRRSKNYINSEVYVFRAIRNLTNLNKEILLYRCYNHLGLLYNDLEEFEYSIKYHGKAMELLDKLPKNEVYLERSLNNLSLVYQKQKKYQLAIDALDRALKNKSLQSKDPNLYAKLIDNRAYCRFLAGDPYMVFDDFNRALKIRDSIHNKAGVGISKMHLAEFYLTKGDSAKALSNARQANELAQSLGLNRDVLSSLVLLSKSDPPRANVYMDRYMSLNDSLLEIERKLRNKFARIEYETEGYIAANEDLKKKNVWITLTSVFAIASLGFLFFGYSQRSKNRTLILERQQQKANEEIYDLMLKQQNREEEGRLKERLRISEELHDGVLARLFSVRMGLGFFQLAKNSKEVKRFDKFMKELQGVEKEIRSVSHALKNEELSSKKDFPKLLDQLLREQSRIGAFNYSLEQDGTIAWNLVDDKIKINLYRTVQEAIYNIIKYAECTEVCVKLKRNKDQVELSIVDNGVGFDIKEKRKGIGLKNMRSRAESNGARIKINSVPKKGTEIRLIITTKTLYHEPES